MPGDVNQRRYDAIMRKIAARGRFGSEPQTRAQASPHERALDMLNAYDSFARLSQASYPKVLCHGPKALQAKVWAAVVIWYRPKGYHGYQKLKLIGLWAHHCQDELCLSLGIRQLSYRAPIFDAGVYRVAIENGFRLYYEDDGHPPGAADQILYQAPFNSKERLAHRRTLTDILSEWRRNATSA